MEAILRWVMLRTRRSPLRHLWNGLYLGTAHGAAAWIGRGGSSVYLLGSLAEGEPLYGLSDIDLVGVAEDRSSRDRLARRVELLHRLVPGLGQLMAHVWLYDKTDFAAVSRSPYPTYELPSARAAFAGGSAPRDSAALLERPGLRPPGQDWRRLRGSEIAEARHASRQDERIAAWLELQYRWKLAYTMLGLREPSRQTVTARIATLVAEASRIWLWLAAGEHVPGRQAPLRRAGELLADERESLLIASALLERLPRSSRAPLHELWPCYVRLSSLIAARIEAEVSRSGATRVELDGDPLGMPLLDWRGLALPPVDWSTAELPVVPLESFQIMDDDGMEPGAVLEAATSNTGRIWRSLRSRHLLLRPNLDVWGSGRLRSIEIPCTDPVSFALAGGHATALFPDVRGWSARDRAARAVAEHRAWLHQEAAAVAEPPAWAGRPPLATWPTPASVSLLLCAARAALFLESLERHTPRLTLTPAATVSSLAARDPSAGEIGPAVLTLLSERVPRRPDLAVLMRLRAAVIRLPPYAARVVC